MEKNDSDYQEPPDALSLRRSIRSGEKRQDADSPLPPLTYLGLGSPLVCTLSTEQLVANLRHSDWTIRVETLKSLERGQRQIPLADILSSLQDEHKAVRAAAVRVLGKSNDDLSLDPLLAALYDPDWHVRSCALMALGKHVQRVPLDQLLYALGDQDESVRAAAVTTLGKLGIQAPLEPLISALQDHSWIVREAAVMALGALGDRTPMDILQQAMADKDSHVHQAAEALLQQPATEVFGRPQELVIEPPVSSCEPPPSTDTFATSYLSDHHQRLNFPIVISHIRRASHGIISIMISLACIVALLLALKVPLTAPTTINPIIDQMHYHAVTGGSARIKWLGKTQFAWSDEQGSVGIADTLFRQVVTLYHTPARILDLARVDNAFYTVEFQDSTIFVRKDNQKVIFSLPTTSQIPRAFFSPDGKYVALALNEPGAITTISVWNTTTGRHVSSYTAQQGTITNISWPDTGSILASVNTAIDRDGQSSWKIELWDMHTGQSVLTQTSIPYINLSQRVIALSWSPDGTRLAYTLADGVVHIHDHITLIDGTYNTRSLLNNDWDGAISWSPDGRYLAATNVNGHVEIWNVSGDTNDGHLVCTYLRHKTPVQSVVWVPNSTIDRLASIDTSGNLFIWDIKAN
ncbi:hypothetical protein KDA_59820 [Dictyobacter alpinus]|uniref:Translation initiation factor beta propellor-like domain-containing protein n=1 Tax=Dictyobacter alpinus TaxID=2014873 RepID=A0A402BGF0_9CHLR|nr:HEAT repeat domain-containing protein [Dictyobacter alpinus]GCE30498.1 hypothetical protein KDA_59820 [Dictyobacter alpinus]